MPVLGNTYKTYEQKGIRESLADIIYNISPTETPFVSNAAKDSVDAVFNEWQLDALAAPDTTNKQLEGDDVQTYTAAVPTTRVGTYCQISRKDALVSGTADKIKKAGRGSEMNYQITKKGSELKRDIEAICLTNQGANAGAAGTARATGSLLAWIRTNTDFGAAGANPAAAAPAPTGTRTDGTQRAFTEAQLKTVLQLCWSAGAEVSTVMLGGLQKQVASGFSGIATKTFNQSAAKAFTVIGAADIYVSDFGTVTFVPNRFQRNRDALVLDFDFIQLDYFRPISKEDLSKTGDTSKKMLIAEWGLRVKNEAALGGVFDLT